MLNEPESRVVPATSKDAEGVVVPIPTLPFNAVVTIESLPSTAVLVPKPIA